MCIKVVRNEKKRIIKLSVRTWECQDKALPEYWQGFFYNKIPHHALRNDVVSFLTGWLEAHYLRYGSSPRHLRVLCSQALLR